MASASIWGWTQRSEKGDWISEAAPSSSQAASSVPFHTACASLMAWRRPSGCQPMQRASKSMRRPQCVQIGRGSMEGPQGGGHGGDHIGMEPASAFCMVESDHLVRTTRWWRFSSRLLRCQRWRFHSQITTAATSSPPSSTYQ